MKNIVIKDDKNRDIIKIGNNGKIAVARFPDMSKSIKQYIIAVYKETTSEDAESLKNLEDFLDYKSEENEFCS